MKGILCCTWFDRCLCFWASRNRKPLIGIQLALQVLAILCLAVQLILGSSGSYDIVAGAPVFTVNWTFAEFSATVWGARRPFFGVAGKVHFNLNHVAFETNLTETPKICFTKPETCIGDPLPTRLVWPLHEFTQLVEDSVTRVASRPLLNLPFFKMVPQALGLAPSEAPWHYELAATSQGHVCGGRNKYAYSYGDPSGLFDCVRIWDPDGSVHGTPRSFGPYNGMNLSFSVMLEKDSGLRRFCDNPQDSIWNTRSAPDLTLASPVESEIERSLWYPSQGFDSINWTQCYGGLLLEGFAWPQCPEIGQYLDGNGGNFTVRKGGKANTTFYITTPRGTYYFINRTASGATFEWSPVWEYDYCYWVFNMTDMNDATYNALTEPLYTCNRRSPEVAAILLGMLLLSVVRILLQLVWYMRCDVKRDQGKKGLNLWLNAVPGIAMPIIYGYYDSGCRDHMGIYSRSSEGLDVYFDPEDLQTLPGNPPESGTAWDLFRVIVSFAYTLILIIEFIIPADKHAVRLPAPPELAEPPGDSGTPIQAASKQEAVSSDDSPAKGGGLLQSVGITMDGMLGQRSGPVQEDHATAATFLEHGVLHVHLVCAKGLKASDRNGKSDPYVLLTLAGQRAKSKTIMETLDPQWDEHFEFTGVRGELLKHNLHVKVFDWDRLTTDDKLGFASVDLEQLLLAQERTDEVELSEQGSVSLRLRWVPQGPKESGAAITQDLEAALPGQGARPEQPLKEGAGKVCVHLLSGEGLKAVDKNGLSDPYVVLKLGRQTLTSRTKRKTLNPRWNQQFVFNSWQSVLPSTPLTLSVYDYDPLLARPWTETIWSDSLGQASVKLEPVCFKSYEVELNNMKIKQRISREATTSLGKLYFSVRWQPDGAVDVRGWLATASARLLDAAAKCITQSPDGSEDDPTAIPAEYQGRVWAARYYMTTYSGPREGECSDHTVSLGWLQQMVTAGYLPRDLKVWRVDGGTAWVSVENKLNHALKAEQKAVKARGGDGKAGQSSE